MLKDNARQIEATMRCPRCKGDQGEYINLDKLPPFIHCDNCDRLIPADSWGLSRFFSAALAPDLKYPCQFCGALDCELNH